MEKILKKIGTISSLCIQIYRDHYHRFLLPGIFLAGWICLDDELYVGISGRDHVWNGTYNTDGRLPGYFFQTQGSGDRCGGSVYHYAGDRLASVK